MHQKSIFGAINRHYMTLNDLIQDILYRYQSRLTLKGGVGFVEVWKIILITLEMIVEQMIRSVCLSHRLRVIRALPHPRVGSIQNWVSPCRRLLGALNAV
jgi:hypothetical protein